MAQLIEKTTEEKSYPTSSAPAQANQVRKVKLHFWQLGWRGKTPAWGLFGIAALIAALMAVPLVYIVVRSVTATGETWRNLWARQIPNLLFSTISLTLVVTIGVTVLGVGLGWLVARTDLPGHRWLRWLLAMPLAVPPYVGALSYIAAFDHNGLAEQFSFGLYDVALGQRAWVYGFWGAALILILACYPYVYLNVVAALSKSNRTLDEAAHSLGFSAWRTFWRVHLPLLRPAISAGALVTAFYLLSEFGVVSLLRYDTFTVVIYRQLATRTDNNAAAILSSVLVGLTILILWGESKAQGQTAFWQVSGHWKPAPRKQLGWWKVPALLFVGLVVFAALLLPILVLIYWLIREIGTGKPRWEQLGDFTLNSFWSAGLAATIALVLALPIAYLAARYRSFFGRLPAQIAISGNALPGVLIALSMIFLFNNWLPALYGTVVVLIVAYVVRFLPLTLQAAEASIRQTTENLEEAAHSLGSNKLAVLRRVTLPLCAPGFIAGWSIFFMTVIRELPATLALRPIGFDTLPVRVWLDASEGYYGRASLPSLLLIAVSAIPLIWILTRLKNSYTLLK
jgi:iron(III) transport system permease protein